MNWIKGLRHFTDLPKVAGEISECSSACYSVMKKPQNGIARHGIIPSFKQFSSDCRNINHNGNLPRRFKLLNHSEANAHRLKHYAMILARRYGQATDNEPNLDRDFMVQLWIADRKKMRNSSTKRKRKHVAYTDDNGSLFDTRALLGRWFTGTSVTGEKSYEEAKTALKEPSNSQYVPELLDSASPEEAQVAPLLARSNLLITRDIEWANLTFGFEQENRYAVVDVADPYTHPVGYIREQSNIIARQLLRTRRPFVASITNYSGNELFRVRRPFWWINSSIYLEVGGKEVGVVHRRWHLWKRVYDLYLGDEQFAVVENPGFWNWTFTLKGIEGEVLAQINRDWRGFGFELFTDAGQYVIQFGDAGSKQEPSSKIQQLEVARSLTLLERAVTVALAVSLDNDYFSRHGGWGVPFYAVGE